MMWSQRKKSEPTVAIHFSSLSWGREFDREVHMFVQDIQSAVMPIGGRTSKHKEFTINLVGERNECSKAEQLLAKIGRCDRTNVVEIVCDAVEKVVRDLTSDGCAVFELVYDNDCLQDIWMFPPLGLRRLPGYYLQIIPRGDWDRWGKKFVIVPADKIWYLELPLSLGGRRRHKRVLRRLNRIDGIGPKFWQHDFLNWEVSSNIFDFQSYTKNAEIYFHRVTRAWGWNRRDYSTNRTTEFFIFYKLIDQARAKTILREHVIREFNRFFNRLGIECEIKVIGLPSLSEIMDVRNKLLTGTISFREILDQVRL